MARYIDADALIRLIEIDALCNFGNFSKRDVIGSIKAIPTADVVPKSEVEELKKIYKKYNKAIRHERVEVAGEIFEEIDKARKRWEAVYSCDYFGYGGGAYGYLETDVDHTIYELKKKYTEGE